MYRSSVSSPISSHYNSLKMPGLTGPSNRSVYKSTYTSSYVSPSSNTTSLYRTPSTQRKSYVGSPLYGSSPGSTSYSRSRVLPTGPGPLSSDGSKKLSSQFSIKPRVSTVTLPRNGPLKADYSKDFGKSYSHYKPSYKSSNESITEINLQGRRSSSLLDISGLSLERDRYEKLDHINNNSSPSKCRNERSSSRASSRSRLYETSTEDSPSTSYYESRRRRYSTSSRDDENIVESRISPIVRNDVICSRTSNKEAGSFISRRHDYNDDKSTDYSNNTLNNKRLTTNNHIQGKLGLRNLGNTCFMNAIIQSLSNTQPLLEYCLNDSYHLELNKGNSSMKGALFNAYVSLMKSLWNEKSDSYVSPNNFKTQVQKFAPRFMGYQQQDAQEFLRYLLEGLHEDVNRVRRPSKPTVVNEQEDDNLSDSEKSKEYWKRYLVRDNSKIVDIFVGQLKSELRFEECSHKSVTFDPFWDLSLPIPKGKSNLNLQDCIGLFMKEEELDAEERPTCSKCKEQRACKKAFSIQKFPKILVLHLKRFSQELYGRKLTSLVEFPVTGLDLTEYSAEPGGARVLYNLYAVCNHSGGTHSGHYTAHCKNPYSTEWNHFNDSRATRTNGQNAVSSEAYVLFYELASQASRL